MNGVHDMGGMQDMGAIDEQKNEPVFHAHWEARAFGVYRAMAGWRLWTLDAVRFQREQIAPLDYFRMSYYERIIDGLVELMLKNRLITQSEIKSGRPDKGAPIRTPPLTAEKVADVIAKGVPARRNVPVTATFQVRQRVRARNINPVGHTRLPRYARGKVGTIDRDHGVFVFPDTNALALGEKPQHVYSVRFDARELWGRQVDRRDSVYIDIWDDNLEPA
jgi:nitrile hydratase subunit beta